MRADRCHLACHRLSANGLGLLGGIVAQRNLELLDESDIALLGIVGSGALVDLLLPSVVLGLALEIEHAGLGGLGEVLANGDLVKSVELEELVVARLGRELLGVDDGRLEGFALSGHDGLMIAV
jgi:hypothetical protein